jgi:hypothetical protein
MKYLKRFFTKNQRPVEIVNDKKYFIRIKYIYSDVNDFSNREKELNTLVYNPRPKVEEFARLLDEGTARIISTGEYTYLEFLSLQCEEMREWDRSPSDTFDIQNIKVPNLNTSEEFLQFIYLLTDELDVPTSNIEIEALRGAAYGRKIGYYIVIENLSIAQINKIKEIYKNK